MSNDVIDALLENNDIDNIQLISFTGGEPSLNVNTINYFIDKCEEKNIEVGNFYIATDGGKTSGDIKFLNVLMRLYCFCVDNETSQVDISRSEWHEYETQPNEVTNKLKCLVFVQEREKLGYKNLINQGRGKELNELNGASGRDIVADGKLNIYDDTIENDYVYSIIEGWRFLDSVYFIVITISKVNRKFYVHRVFVILFQSF